MRVSSSALIGSSHLLLDRLVIHAEISGIGPRGGATWKCFVMTEIIVMMFSRTVITVGIPCLCGSLTNDADG